MATRRKVRKKIWRLRDNTLYRCNIAEAAERLGYTLEGIKRRIRSGKIKAYKLGGNWYVVMPGFRRRI